ncbi:MAG: hypothetical protein P1S59_03005 [bacterium]|nr:hypothetical protein [bacterium]
MMIRPGNVMASGEGGEIFFWGILLYVLHTHHEYDLSNKRLVVEKYISSNRTPREIQITSDGIEVLKYAPSNNTPKLVKLTPDRIEVKRYVGGDLSPRLIRFESL